MTGFDLLVSRVALDSEIRNALASSAGVAPEDIELLADYPTNRLGGNVKVICIKSEAEGDFPLKLSIDAPRGKLSIDFLDIAQNLSQRLQASLLMDDGSSNPYKMKMIRPEKEPCTVELRAAEADDGIFRLKDAPPQN